MYIGSGNALLFPLVHGELDILHVLAMSVNFPFFQAGDILEYK